MSTRQAAFEPILETEKPISLYPIRHERIWKYYTDSVASMWTPEEIHLADDLLDWESLENTEQAFLKMVLAFFASSDFIVNENLGDDFADIVRYRELEIYYHFQIMMEDIHSRTYADLIETYVQDAEEKRQLFEAVETIPIVKKKAEWCRRFINMSCGDGGMTREQRIHNFVTRLVAFAVVEGVFFSGSFCSIFWMKKRGKLPGLTFSNELISRDEGVHRDVACYIYRENIVNKLTEAEVLDIVTSGVELEKEFVCEAIPVDMIGMNKELMCQYIEFVADHLLQSLGYRKYYTTENPFDWMNMISMEGKTNFFEKRVGEYAKGLAETSARDNEIAFDDEF